MKQADFPQDEIKRVKALNSLSLLDTPPESDFDHITQFTQSYFAVSIALISLVDSNRQWFKSKQGLDVCETSRSVAFCSHTILRDDVLVVEDTVEDIRFHDNPLVTGAPHIRFYAGCPLKTYDGYRIGTLCIIDTKPRSFGHNECEQLKDYAKLVEGIIHQRANKNYPDDKINLTQYVSRWLKGYIYSLTSRFVSGTLSIFSVVTVIGSGILINYYWPNRLTLYEYLFVVGVLTGTLVYTLLRLPRLLRLSVEAAHQSTIRGERRFRDAIESLPGGFVIFDTEQRLAVFNKQFLKMYAGIANVLKTGKKYQDIRAFAMKVNFIEHSSKISVFNSHLKSDTREIHLVDGRWIRIVERAMNDGGVVGYHVDITEQKLQTQQLSDAKQKAEEANYAKSQFLANVSHEVRTPLNGVIGLVDVLIEDEEATTSQRNYLNTVQDSALHLLHILNDILDFSKIEAGQVSIQNTGVDIRSALYSVCDLMKQQMSRKNLDYTIKISETLSTPLQTDYKRLRQIVINLLSNAIKFTDEGSITINAKPVKSEGKCYMNMFEISITDTGCGISKEHIEIIKEPFRQVENGIDRRHEGTGLGLAISNRLAELMGGQIYFISTLGVGTTVRLLLPMKFSKELAKNSINNEALSRIKTSAKSREKKRVLLADDSRTNQLVIKAMLQNSRYELVTVENGLEAVEAVRNAHFDIILMDVQMPKMDGVKATSLIRNLEAENSNRTTIIALTANAMFGEKDRLISVGMDDYLSKPISKTFLLSTLEKWNK